MSIRTRIIVAALAVVALVNAVYLVYFVKNTRSEALTALHNHIAETDQLLKSVIAGPLYDGNVEQLNTNLDSFFLNPDILEIVLTEYNGSIRITRKREPFTNQGIELASQVIIPRGIDQLGKIHTTYTTANIEQRLAKFRTDILLFAGIMMLGLLTVIYGVASGLTRPIDRLTKAARAMADGELDQAIEMQGAQELAILGQSFIRMRDAVRQKIADLAENNRQLNAEILQRQAAEEGRNRLISILEATTDIVGMANPEGRMIYLNRAGQDIMGIESVGELSATIRNAHPPWAAELILNTGIPAAIQQGVWSGETTILDRNGREIEVSQVILSHKDAQGKLLYLSTIMRDITARKLARQALERSEQRYRNLMESAPDAIYINQNGIYTYLNPAALRLFGAKNVSELLGTRVLDRIHTQSHDLVRERMRIMTEDFQAVPALEEKFIRMDGSLVDVEVTAAPYADSDEKGMQVIVRDITERKRLEKSSEEALNRLQKIASRVPGVVYEFLLRPDGSSCFPFASDAIREIYRVNPEDVREDSSKVFAILHPEDFDAITASIQESAKNLTIWSLEYRVKFDDGSVRWLLGNAIPQREADGAVLWHGFITDITERKRVEEALRISEERLRHAVHVAKIGIFDHDHLADDVYWSPEIREMFGWGAEEVIDLQGFLACIHPDDIEAVTAAVRRSHDTAGNGGYDVSYRTIRSSGDIVWIDAYGQTFFQGEGPTRRPIRTVGAVADITQRTNAELALKQLNVELEQRIAERTAELAKSNESLQDTVATLQRAQEELVRSEKLASLGALVAGVAHELNTPLGNSLTVATTLEEKVRHFRAEVEVGHLRRSSLTAFLVSSEQAVLMLTRNLTNASELIGHFKQVSVDQTSDQRRRFDLREVVREILTTLQPQFKNTSHRILIDIPSGIEMDSFPGPLGQVINNLVSNALIHGLEQTVVGEIKIEAAQTDRQVRIAISDNGRGIDPEHMPKIFDPFFTTRLGQGGSGLGLHIVYNIITGVLGGKITVESKIGQGTQFMLNLPQDAPIQSS